MATEEEMFYLRLRWSIDSYLEYNYLGICDWAEPKKYYIGDPISRVEGNLGFITDNKAIQLKFVVYLLEGIDEISEIPWSKLSPYCINPGCTDRRTIELKCETLDKGR